MAERILNTYTEWQDPEDKLSEEEIRELCCADAEVDPCSEYGKVSPWAGEPADPPEDLAPDPKRVNVHVELVGPSGDCGELHEEWTDRNNCCQEAVPLAWDSERSAVVVPADSTALVYVTGGAPPYYWRVRGDGFYTDPGLRWQDAVTEVPELRIYASSAACGGAAIGVTDNCTETQGWVRSAIGRWVQRDPADCPYENVAGQYVTEVRDAYLCGKDWYYLEAVVGRWKMVQIFASHVETAQVDGERKGAAAMAALAAETMGYYKTQRNLIDPGATLAAGVVSPSEEISWQFFGDAFGSAGVRQINDSHFEYGFALGTMNEGCHSSPAAWEWIC